MTNSINSLSARQRQAIQTRQKLLEAGRDIFLQHGFHKATISQIIKQARTGYGTAYVYFKNKDQLFSVLMEELMGQFYQVAELPFEPRTKEEAYTMISHQVHLFLSLAFKEREMMKVVKEAIGISSEVEKQWIQIRKKFILRISQDISYAQSKGLAKQQLDPLLIAKGWFYSNEMFMWDLIQLEKEDSIEEVIHHLTTIYTSGLYT
ncbi:TetR/AcrR family transcriptional regulator [Caldalkalibacillus mannanilyticus]|uniref:TetR/AcrR family transcriptional regulator n=1 Tax=Caldalkalibacillus mannanilyticus TaxID=1418 RepID=UPI0004697094|nr:TetR/AcrR family transcriptional regulator [Caldalkalibacillus mannanilyticus]